MPKKNPDPDQRKNRAFWGTAEELQAVIDYRDYLAGKASPEQVERLRLRHQDERAPTPSDGASGAPLEGASTTSSSADVFELNFPPLPEGESDDEEEGEAKPKKYVEWSVFPPILAHIPNRPRQRERETVLRFLTQYGPPDRRLEVAPTVSVWTFDELLRESGVTAQDRAILLTMEQRTAQAFYTNACQGGTGLVRFAT